MYIDIGTMWFSCRHGRKGKCTWALVHADLYGRCSTKSNSNHCFGDACWESPLCLYQFSSHLHANARKPHVVYFWPIQCCSWKAWKITTFNMVEVGSRVLTKSGISWGGIPIVYMQCSQFSFAIMVQISFMPVSLHWWRCSTVSMQVPQQGQISILQNFQWCMFIASGIHL